jgi:glycerophosphoryl diester phosphodiesterase
MTSVYAHRGATGPAVENTVEAFLEARRLGADGVELDVRRSADGALVVHHDPVLPGIGPVGDILVRDLPRHVPLLDAVLDACDGLIVNVEIKNGPDEPGFDPGESIAQLVADTVADAGWAERVIVSSFRIETIRAVRDADPRLSVGWQLGLRSDVPASVAVAAKDSLAAIHPFVSQVDAALVATAHDLGLAVNVWTVNHDDDLSAMGTLGVDAVITDRLAPALAILHGV